MSDRVYKLWVKETTPNPLYVDIFEQLRNSPVYRDAIVEHVEYDSAKDDEFAIKYRKAGNDQMKQNNMPKAMELYNQSLCFAVNGLDQLCLAYANRSICFLHFKMYDECLVDIELAKMSNYPEHLLPKLEQRKNDCMTLMIGAVRQQPLQPSLSFDADDRIPCMANVLKIEENEEFGRHFIAQCDIKEDRVVLIEEYLMKLSNGNSKYSRCDNCLKATTNLIPCKTCTKVMFCNDVCSMKNHRFECKLKTLKMFQGQTGIAPQNCVKFLIRAVLALQDDFSTAEELMEFVETYRARENRNEIVVSIGSPKSMLKAFFAHYNEVSMDIGQVKILIITCVAYDVIMRLDIKMKFQSIMVERFLMHLLTHFASMFTSNNILLQEWSDQYIDIIEKDGMETFGQGLCNIAAYFNHACMPNVIRLATTNHTIVKTIRRIKKGEQIFVRYGIDPNWPTAKRRERMLYMCGFECKCQLCMCNGPALTENSRMKSEFKNLSMEIAPLLFGASKNLREWISLKAKLFSFVKKYQDIPMSESIILSYEFISMILTRELR